MATATKKAPAKKAAAPAKKLTPAKAVKKPAPAKPVGTVEAKPATRKGVSGSDRKPHVRMDPAERGKLLLAAAYKLAAGKSGIAGLTRATIAKEAGVTDGLVNRYLGNRAQMERSVALAAVETRTTKVIAEAIGRGVQISQEDMPRALWREAKALLAK